MVLFHLEEFCRAKRHTTSKITFTISLFSVRSEFLLLQPQKASACPGCPTSTYLWMILMTMLRRRREEMRRGRIRSIRDNVWGREYKERSMGEYKGSMKDDVWGRENRGIGLIKKIMRREKKERCMDEWWYWEEGIVGNIKGWVKMWGGWVMRSTRARRLWGRYAGGGERIRNGWVINKLQIKWGGTWGVMSDDDDDEEEEEEEEEERKRKWNEELRWVRAIIIKSTRSRCGKKILLPNRTAQ